ncbi:MAG: protein YgfX [Salinisphaera sp.]|uniref:protein YgfX n=1 Tax=Salinisphaera sp. TaxID=1914330 RepID=UPI003C79D281
MATQAAYAVPVSFTDTIHVTFRPSPTLRTANLLAHAAAFIVLVAFAVSRPLFGLLAVLVVLSAIRSEHVLRLQHSGAPVRLRWAGDHRLYWQDNEGREHRGECIEAKSWGAAWVRLRMRASDRRFARVIVIPFDAVNADVHRRLRARCRVMPPGRGQ